MVFERNILKPAGNLLLASPATRRRLMKRYTFTVEYNDTLTSPWTNSDAHLRQPASANLEDRRFPDPAMSISGRVQPCTWSPMPKRQAGSAERMMPALLPRIIRVSSVIGLNPKTPPMKTTTVHRGLGILCPLVMWATPAPAASLTWGPSGAGGSGTWDTNVPFNWSNGTSAVKWPTTRNFVRLRVTKNP
jgi:hypothetical protein